MAATRSALAIPDNDFEAQRERRIAENQARLAALGVSLASRSITKSLRSQSRKFSSHASSKKPSKSINPKTRVQPARQSRRLQGDKPEFEMLVEEPTFECDEATGLLQLPKIGKEELPQTRLEQIEKIRTSTAQTRNTVYDRQLGITCHFCRQKTLCKEPDCPRCSKRDESAKCSGKSECTKCGTATGQFCQSCLKLRYGLDLAEIKRSGDWICPHCYEEEHPNEGWICNSSICMTRRGLKPTGIAIHKARELGFESVAHLVKAQLMKHRKGAKTEPPPL